MHMWWLLLSCGLYYDPNVVFISRHRAAPHTGGKWYYSIASVMSVWDGLGAKDFDVVFSNKPCHFGINWAILRLVLGLNMFLNSPLWLQDVTIREYIVILHQNHELPIIWLIKSLDDMVIVWEMVSRFSIILRYRPSFLLTTHNHC